MPFMTPTVVPPTSTACRPPRKQFALAGLCALLGLPALPAMAQAPASPPASAHTFEFAPQPWKRYVITTSVQTRSALTGEGLPTPVRMVDVTTHSLEIVTEAEDFLGGVSGTIEVIDSRGQSMVGTVQGIGHVTPLTPLIGAKVGFRLSRDGSFRVGKVDLPSGSKAGRASVESLRQMAERLIFPLKLPERGAMIGRPFQTSKPQDLTIEKQQIPVELLNRYTLERADDEVLLFRTDAVIRPRNPDQIVTAFGRGSGSILLHRRLGMANEINEKLRMEAAFMGDRGKVSYVADTESQTLILMNDRSPQGVAERN